MRRVRLVLGAALVLAGTGLLASSAKAWGGECIHTVAAGQTLGHIANRHGVSQRSLIDANPELKKNPDLLRVGQELDVCAAKELHAQKEAAEKTASAAAADSTKEEKKPRAVRSCGSGGQIVEHEVSSGETLSKIISHYGITEKELYRRNPDLSRDPKLLRVGQTIKICADQQRVVNSKVCGYQTPLFQHEVVPGENLGSIAGRYGVRRGDLQKWNSRLRKNPDLLSVGQKVAVCPEIAPRVREKLEYTVREGDNLGAIANRYDLTTRELVRFQRGALDDPSSLRPGQKLTVYADGDIFPGFGTDDRDKGVLTAGVQLPSGRNYTIKWEAGAWGTGETIRSIQAAIANYKKKMPGGPKVYIGDISKKGGGPFKPHNSHQHGRDVDVAYVIEGSGEAKFRTATADNLDVARTWRLIKSFIDTDQVVYVFVDYKIQKLLYEHAKARGASEELLDELFQYPRGRNRSHGLIRHWKGHTNHFHVRFRK
ncbi:penicillin-insensitive murein endopeptidase [Paraliomyxa miuraensis]|uniref:penicillin-insensitive murein endopeptidase n=1 Tax=Paraliomyxa miuraensis TaxID=376150 RepID=UPI00225BD138|nr:penicillin-insensitive murein endopeptidase [Paraliomyxa miuraensis]MCX4247387.1 penicillin-insensitive murein endopeptidase [Paraliomyxa miuraensis]